VPVGARVHFGGPQSRFRGNIHKAVHLSAQLSYSARKVLILDEQGHKFAPSLGGEWALAEQRP
jgi:hypothetical protein